MRHSRHQASRILLHCHCVVYFMFQGSNIVQTASPWRDVWCGLVPIGEPCHSVTTTGLKYNLGKLNVCMEKSPTSWHPARLSPVTVLHWSCIITHEIPFCSWQPRVRLNPTNRDIIARDFYEFGHFPEKYITVTPILMQGGGVALFTPQCISVYNYVWSTPEHYSYCYYISKLGCCLLG